MNNYARGLQEYKTQSVNTMTQGELLLLLYDNMIKRLKKASILLDHEDFGNFEKEVTGAYKIVRYLDGALDQRFPVSKNLRQLYEYFGYELIRLNAGRHKEIIDELIPLITELRDSFGEADKLARKAR